MQISSTRPLAGFFVSMTLLMASVVGVTWLLKSQEIGPAGRLALAFIPPLIWAFSIILLLRGIRLLDEMQRRIHLEALAIAFPSLAVAILTCEYLRKAGFIASLKPDHVLMMMMALLVISYLITWRRYQ